MLAFLGILYFIPLGIEPLTEVYFENHTQLPQTIDLGKNYEFSFTVHNLEYQNMNYTYNINAYDANNSLLFNIGSGNFGLADNESRTFTQNYAFANSFERAKIEILVEKIKIETPWFEKKLWWPDPNYPTKIDLHFWVDKSK